MEQPVCPVPSCGTDGRATSAGSSSMLCRGYGALDVRCMANWASTDPEDRESYGKYLAAVLNEEGR